MPVYEFLCEPCNTIYKFFSRTVNTEKIPGCPKCDNARLQRLASTFATVSGKSDETDEDGLPPMDEAKMEKAMALLARDADKLDEDDPRQAAQLMRKLSDATGLNLGSGMEEALRRMEMGEDPEKIEEEMGDLLDEEEPFLVQARKHLAAYKPRPNLDDKLYDL